MRSRAARGVRPASTEGGETKCGANKVTCKKEQSSRKREDKERAREKSEKKGSKIASSTDAGGQEGDRRRT